MEVLPSDAQLVPADLVLQLLAAVHLVVEAALFQKRGVRAALGDPAVRQHEDLVGVLDGRDAVRDEDRGAPARDRAQAVQDLRFRVRVHRRENVVEDQDARPLGNGACQRGALLLAAGEGHATLADDRVVALGKAHHVLVELGDLAGIVEVVLGQLVRVAKANVGAQRHGEQERLLRRVADRLAERRERVRPHIAAVDQYLSRGDVEEPRDQVDERRLARPGGAHDGQRRAGRHLEADVAQHRRAGVVAVGEGDVAELDLAADRARRWRPARRGWSVARPTVPAGV